ncbi:MAG: SPFH domain-containing protein [Pseudomonadota bacterium]
MSQVFEKPFRPMSGWPVLFVVLILVGLSIAGFLTLQPLVAALFIAVTIFVFFGFMAIAPNDARVLLLFGNYKGSVTESGFFWVNPLFSKKKISRRVRNFETGSQAIPQKKSNEGKIVQERGRTGGRPSKVNDRDGNPIEISAVVVWKVVDTAEALFEVDDYEDYVAVQSEAALRNLTSRYPYDGEENEDSLRGDTSAIGEVLKEDIQERLGKAGVEAIEARISHLAYAPEIAAAMLQRQQAQAVVAARTKIVEGAVGMVEMALDQLKRDGIIELDEERRAAMVSNLLVVLCSDRHTQPVVNTGSLYS